MKDEDWIAVGRLLRDKRNIAGLTRAQLSKLVRLSVDTIKDAETARREPSRATLIRLCRVPELNLQWAEIPGDLPEPPGMHNAQNQGDGSRLACPTCGSKTLRAVMRAGRAIPYKMFDALRIPDEIPMFACTQCRATFLDVANSRQIQRLASLAFDRRLRSMAREAIAELRKHISQRGLELLLGLSSGYLSRLFTESGTPSAPLVAYLVSIAKEPDRRLAELKSFWTATPDSPASGP